MRYITLYIFLLFGFFLGIFISKSNLDKISFNQNFLEKYYLSDYNYTFEVKDLYKKDDNYNSYIVSLNAITGVIVDKNIRGIVYIPNNYSLSKGDVLAINTKIFNIDNIDKFNYKNFLLTKQIYFKAYISNFEIIGQNKGFLSYLEKIRNVVLEKINNIFPKEEAILLSGILIGARENIPKDLVSDFNNSGTTHFIAVSGSNITILIVFLGIIFKFFPVIIRTIFIISFVIIFCIFVGPETSVIRAGIMGILGYLILITGRKTVSLTMLLVAAFLMILYNPLYINYDLSFHLSFLAVLGILYFKEYFDKILFVLPNILAIRESFSLTLSALLFTFPIIFFNFGQISLLAPLSNIAFAWTIPLVMFLGFLSVVTSFINIFIGIIIGFPAFLFLKWDILVVHFFGNLDRYIIKGDFGDYGIYFEVVYFTLLLFFILKKPKFVL
nr:ComEC/Rec2 family competence protein [Candidatus Gracilibacteria bacterium]